MLARSQGRPALAQDRRGQRENAPPAGIPMPPPARDHPRLPQGRASGAVADDEPVRMMLRSAPPLGALLATMVASGGFPDAYTREVTPSTSRTGAARPAAGGSGVAERPCNTAGPLSALRRLTTGWLALGLASVAIAFSCAAPTPAMATTVGAACSQTGDICVAAKKLNGRVKLEIALAADYFRRYRLCIRKPSGATRCRRFHVGKLKRRSLPGDRVDLGRRFGGAAPGRYRVRWRLGNATLAAPLAFRVRASRRARRGGSAKASRSSANHSAIPSGSGRTASVPVGPARRRRGTFVFNGTRGAKRPKRLSVAHMTSPRTGLPAYDETRLVARGLRWRRWGKRQAVGRGRLTYCVAGYRRCKTYRGRVQLAKRTPDYEVPGLYTYDRARFVIRGTIRTPWLVPWGA